MSEEQIVHNIRELVTELAAAGRYDLLLSGVGVPALQMLNIEAAKERLSPLVITDDYRFIMPALNKEVELEPIHTTLYIFYLQHPEGVETKKLVDYRSELIELYRRIGNRISSNKIEKSIDRLVNPTDNSINEKCARIKAAFAALVDDNQLRYYAISNHTERHIDGFSKVWFERKKSISLPRKLITYPKDILPISSP